MLLQISKKGYKTKPPKTQMAMIKSGLQTSNPVDCSLKEIVSYIEKGYTISPAVIKGGLTAKNWFSQQIFLCDIDNDAKDEKYLNIDEAVELCNKVGLPCAFIIETFSSTPEHPKFRIGFIFNEVVKDTNKRAVIIETLTSLFRQADAACTNADRIFLGTNKKCAYFDEKAVITFENIIANHKVVDKDVSNKTLQDLKDEFDFCNYLRIECGEVTTETNKYIMFKNCPICGHRDDFVYYKDAKTFYCYGANGSKGGSIIDYVMYTQNKSKAEAIHYFKVDIMGIKEKGKLDIKSLICGISVVQNAKGYDWILRNLFAKGLLSIMFGEGGCGKTWLLLKLATSLTNGCGEWFGINIEKQLKVLLFEGDTPNTLIKNRINKLGCALNDDYFKYINRFEAEQEGANLNLFQKEGREHFEAFISECRPDFVIIDTLISFIDDEQKPEAVKGVIDCLRELAFKYNCHILICHHSRKQDNLRKRKKLEQSDVIGTSVLTRLVSMVIGIEQTEDENIIDVKKTWHQPHGCMKFSIVDDFDNKTLIKFDICEKSLSKKNKAKNEIANYIYEKQRCTRIELVKNLDRFSESTIKSALKDLEENGQITSEGNTKNKVFIYNKIQPNTSETK